MKIGESLSSQRPEVRLPLEIITQIVTYLPSGSFWQSSTWACCLVSRQWYAAAIARLYNRPHLSGPKFESFAAVICPPVNAHVRRVGLEHHVRYLDMSGIAYESTNSQTARLLRRVGPTLEEFVAPATSFSTSCLAPLSKCQRLRCLDLRLTQSQSFSNIDIYALLRTIAKLKNLVKLSLPPFNFVESGREDARNAPFEWPPNLNELQFNNSFCMRCHLPDTVNVLVVKDCKSFEGFDLIPTRENAFPQITSLQMNVLDPVLSWSLELWIEIFPQLRFLSLPWRGVQGTYLAHPRDAAQPIPLIEQLELTSDEEEAADLNTGRLMTWIATNLPYLWRVQLDEAWMQYDDLWADCQAVDDTLKDRVRAQNEAAGHQIHDAEEAGVWFV